MKKYICLLLILSFMFSGCSLAAHNIKEPVDFYYPRVCSRPDEYKTYFSEGAVGSELREASGHKDDLFYLLSMYLKGPVDPELVSSFPPGSTVVEISREGRGLTVSLNAIAANMEDIDLTIACACLAKTCMGLADVDFVHIEARSFGGSLLYSCTMNGDILLFDDMFPPASTEAEETQ